MTDPVCKSTISPTTVKSRTNFEGCTYIHINDLPVGVLYGGVIGFYPLIVDELCCNPNCLVLVTRPASQKGVMEMNL